MGLYRAASCDEFITLKPTKLGILDGTEWIHDLCYLIICVSAKPTSPSKVFKTVTKVTSAL